VNINVNVTLSLSPDLARRLDALLGIEGARKHLEEQILATEAQLVAVVTPLVPAIDAYMTSVDAALATAINNAANANDPALDALVTAVQAEHDKLVAATVPVAQAINVTPPAAPQTAVDANATA
jgi:predicted glycosyl hydrolase (DUF1957 family)